MSLADRRNKAKTAQPKTETSSGSRIQAVQVQGEDPNFELIHAHWEGKQLKKTGEAALGRARRLYNVVKQKLFEDRSQDRPKQFKFSAMISPDTEHTVTINVRENGYGTFDDTTLDKVREIVGDQFVDAYITTHIEAKVDFSIVPEDKHDAVEALTEQINQLVGAEVVSWEFTNRPNSAFHPARTQLTKTQDMQLDELVPTTMAFGR